MALPTDPYDPLAIPAWDGPWPPDPSWDDPVLAAAPILPPPAESPVPDVAFQGGQDVEVPTTLGFPTNPDAPPAQPAAAAPWDADLIELDAPAAPDWSGLEQPATAEPADADLIELEEPTPEPYAPTAAEREARLGELLPTLSDEDLALRRCQRDQAAQDQAIADTARAAAADRKAAEDNERVYRQAVERTRQQQDAIAAESDRLAAERVDPDGWRDSRSLFQTVAMYAAGIVGGLIQSRTGGPNQGLAMINDAIEKHIDAQKANLAHRRDMLGRKASALGEQQARIGEDYATEEAFRQAAWKRAIADIETEQQQYDPAGTRALKLEGFKRELAGQAAAAQAAAADRMLDREIKVGEYDLKVATFNETARKNAAAEQLAARKAAGGGGGGSGKLTKAKLTPEQLAAVLPPGSWIPPTGMPPMTIEEYGRIAEAGRKGMALNDPTEQQKQERDLAVSGPTGRLMNADGKPYLPPTAAAEPTRVKLDAAEQVAGIIDEILAIRSRVGGESAAFNSDDYQSLQVLQNQIVKLEKTQAEGMSSDEDMKKLAAAVGAADVASFRAQTAGLKKGRERTVAAVNSWLSKHNYTGKPVVFPDNFKKAKLTKEQKKAAALASSTTGEKGQSIPTAAILANPVVVGPARLLESAIRKENPNLGEGDEKAQIDAWVSAAVGGDPAKAAEALPILQQLAKDARSPAIRTYARDALHAAKVAAGRAAGLGPMEAYLAAHAKPDDEDEE